LEPAPSGQNQSYNNKRFQWLTKSTWKSLRNHIQTIAFKVVPREGDRHAPVTLPQGTTHRCKGSFPEGVTTMRATGRRIIAPAGNAQPRRQAALTGLGSDSKTTLIVTVLITTMGLIGTEAEQGFWRVSP